MFEEFNPSSRDSDPLSHKGVRRAITERKKKEKVDAMTRTKMVKVDDDDEDEEVADVYKKYNDPGSTYTTESE